MTVDTFRVWQFPQDGSRRMRVDGRQNAEWLLDRLSRSFAFKTSEPIREEQGSTCWVFHLMYTSQMGSRTLDRLLASIPEIRLMSDLA